MKRNKITAFLLSAVMTMSIASPTIHAADTALKKSDYQYFLNNSDVTAYVEMGEKINGKNMGFIDGIAQGITSKSDPIYNELVTLDGLDARRQEKANSYYFTIDDEFYEKGDTEILFSIAYYDYGPSPGKFNFEYHAIDGTVKSETIIKPHTTKGWNVRTICIEDIDLSAKYENGATIRIVNNYYNAFRKVEALNVTKARREKQEVNLTCLGNDIMLQFDDLCILKINDSNYYSKELANPVTAYDVQELINIITNSKDKNNASKKETLTQEHLLEMFMDASGIVPEYGETVFDAAMRIGITNDGLFLYDKAPATKFNMLWAAYNTLICANNEDGSSLLAKLIADGFYNNKNVDEIESEYFKNLYNKSNSSAGATSFDYFLNTNEHSAYITLAEEFEGKGIEFVNKDKTYSAYPNFNKLMTYDGLPGRQQGGTSSFKLSDEFYEEGDTEFLVSVVFYDFGPGRGSFTFNYNNDKGGVSSITHIKPGTNPGWYVRTAIVSDMDPSAVDENGGTFNFVGGAINAFRKVEVLNLSKARREGWDLNFTCLGNDAIVNFSTLLLMDMSDSRFTNDKLSQPVTAYDTQDLINIITGSTAKNTASKTLTYTQGELVSKFLNLLGITRESGESAVDAAYRSGIGNGTMLIKDSAPASTDDMLRLAYNALTYINPSTDRMLYDDIIKNGFYNDKDVTSIDASVFGERYYKEPRYLPYTRITDPVTGRTYQYVNLFGGDLYRPYVTTPQWLYDGVSFLCGTKTGALFIYNTETQMLTYVDNMKPSSMPDAFSTPSGVFYLKNGGSGQEVWQVDPEDLSTKKCVYKLPSSVRGIYGLSVTDDGKWGSFDLYSDANASIFAGRDVTRPEASIVRVNFETGEAEYGSATFTTEEGIDDHHQINPRYPNLVAYSHEGFGTGSGGISIRVSDRCHIYDFDTGKDVFINQGSPGDSYLDLRPNLRFGHDFWSFDGEYRTAINYSQLYANLNFEGERRTNSGFIITDKDGTHPRFYSVTPWGANHGGLSYDNKMFVVDHNHAVTLVSADTHQAFPIATFPAMYGMESHPCQPHPTMSGASHKFVWTIRHNKTLGIAWYDFTDIYENEVAKGGFYSMGNGISRISYKGLECESQETVMDGEACVTANPACWLFCDVDRDYLDAEKCSVKLTFDYYDNTTGPLELVYTHGMEEYNDYWKSFTRSMKVNRTGTNKWKTAELTIDSIRLESVSTFGADFKIKGSQGSVYIKNMKIERTDTENDNS